MSQLVTAMPVRVRYTKRRQRPVEVRVGRTLSSACAGVGKTRVSALRAAAERMRQTALKMESMAEKLEGEQNQ